MAYYLRNAIATHEILPGENIIVKTIDVSNFRGALILNSTGWIDKGYIVQIETDTKIFTFADGFQKVPSFVINPFPTATGYFYTTITGYKPKFTK